MRPARVLVTLQRVARAINSIVLCPSGFPFITFFLRFTYRVTRTAPRHEDFARLQVIIILLFVVAVTADRPASLQDGFFSRTRSLVWITTQSGLRRRVVYRNAKRVITCTSYANDLETDDSRLDGANRPVSETAFETERGPEGGPRAGPRSGPRSGLRADEIAGDACAGQSIWNVTEKQAKVGKTAEEDSALVFSNTPSGGSYLPKGKFKILNNNNICGSLFQNFKKFKIRK